MPRCVGPLLLVAALALLGGCGDGKCVVHGTVALDGQAVQNGGITFVSTDGPLIRAGAVIADGRFATRLPPGQYKIELDAQRITGKRVQKDFDGKDEEVPVIEPLFPKYYGSESILVETIKPGENVIALDLKSTK